MNNLPAYQTNHPFFRNIKPGMSEKALHYKDKMDNYSKLDRKEKISVFSELLELNFSWPDPLRQEGFWCDKEEENYLFKEFPYPKENEMSEDEIADFLKKLAKVESKTPTFRYMGYSTCRICGLRQNGTQTFHTELFAWPEGYKHYIKEHGVRPSAAFVLHIRGLIT
jgi:hypothetical protein